MFYSNLINYLNNADFNSFFRDNGNDTDKFTDLAVERFLQKGMIEDLTDRCKQMMIEKNKFDVYEKYKEQGKLDNDTIRIFEKKKELKNIQDVLMNLNLKDEEDYSESVCELEY